VRAFIRLRLESAFRISEATDGQEGSEMAIDLMPDFIISDVMMPKKDGYEVCQTLKTDLRTCYIPIILLTAKAAQAEKLEGLETGADLLRQQAGTVSEIAFQTGFGSTAYFVKCFKEQVGETPECRSWLCGGAVASWLNQTEPAFLPF